MVAASSSKMSRGCIAVYVVLYSGRLKVDLNEKGWEVLTGF
jgi:hypothetical protein